jgi:hypothetical protein
MPHWQFCGYVTSRDATDPMGSLVENHRHRGRCTLLPRHRHPGPGVLFVFRVRDEFSGNIRGDLEDRAKVVQLTAAEIEATPDFGGAPDTQYILGLATIQGGVKTLLNIEKIFLEDGSVSLTLMPKPEPSTQP